MKALPKLSKAQQAAWARILEWRSTYRLTRIFRAGGTAGWRDNRENSVATSDATLKALTRKGLLISAGEEFGFNRYMVNPDYLPASEPAAAPVSEPATDDAPGAEYWNNLTPDQRYELWNLNDGHGIWSHRLASVMFDRLTSEYPGLIRSDGVHFGLTEAASAMVEQYGMEADGSYKREPTTAPVQKTPRLELGCEVTILAGEVAGEVGHICGINHITGGFRVRINETGYWAWYESHELEPVAASEPATDDRPNTDEARLLDRITELEIHRQRLENENDHRASQLEVLRVYVKELEVENAKLREQVEALRVRLAEMEAENAKLNDECEVLSGKLVQMEQARDFWRVKYRRAIKDIRRTVVEELQAAIDAAPAGFRQAAIEQYMTNALD